MSSVFDFDEEYQTKVLAHMLCDHNFLNQVDGLIKAEYFENDASHHVARLVLDFYAKYRQTPDRKSFVKILREEIAAKRIRPDIKEDVVNKVKELYNEDLAGRAYVIETIEQFAKTQALEAAMMQAIDLVEKRDFGKIREIMTSAMEVGAMSNYREYDPFEELNNRVKKRELIASGAIPSEGITTGCRELDNCMLPHRGWGRKELSVLVGGAKSGKTAAMLHFAIRACENGYNVLYVSLEVGDERVADRFDANISGIEVNQLDRHSKEVAEAVREFQRNSGIFKIREFPSGGYTPNQLRRLLNTYAARGIVFDMVVVDYADIMGADQHFKEERHRTASIYINLRAIASDYNIALITATQTNRDGQKKAKVGTTDETDVAEDFSKARHCDIMITINITETERKDGEIRLFFALMRNAESKFTMRFKSNYRNMRFIDKFIGRE